MSAHAVAMSNTYSASTRRPGFLLKMIIFLSFAVAMTGLMALIASRQNSLLGIWMGIFAVLCIGLAIGSAARIIFYEWSGFVRFFAILLGVPISMFAFGFLTNWYFGIGPLNPWLEGVIDPYELAQLAGTFLVAFIVVEAWWKRAVRVSEVREMPAEPRRSRSRYKEPSLVMMQSQPVGYARTSTHHTTESLTPAPKAPPRLKFMKSTKSRSKKRSRTDKLVLARTVTNTRSRRGLSRRKPALQISMYEDHRCPFCLEEVKRNDPRGVKKCDVCNTLHHADCWEITGFCQVPHLNT